MTKQEMVLEHLKKHGSITVRQMTGAPFYINCPYRTIDDLRGKGYEIEDEPVPKITKTVKGGKTIKTTVIYKKYYMEREQSARERWLK
jgi:hypothetical protein